MTSQLIALRRQYQLAGMREALRLWARMRGEHVIELSTVRRVVALIDADYRQPTLETLSRWLYDSLIADGDGLRAITPAAIPVSLMMGTGMNLADAGAHPLGLPGNIGEVVLRLADVVSGEGELARLTRRVGEEQGRGEVFIIDDGEDPALTGFLL